MPRKPRTVVAGMPHHVTQRGGRRQNVFFCDKHYGLYLNALKYYAAEYGSTILAYCLMTNHVHLMLLPREENSLRWTLQMTHKRYAEIINEEMDWKGHLWQERFYSSPLDETYFWVAMRYIERNPVEAKIVEHAADYNWSSAAAHCGLRQDSLVDHNDQWIKRARLNQNWHDWLKEPESPNEVNVLRNNTRNDLPSGSKDFLDKLEIKFNRTMRPTKRGPKSAKNLQTSLEKIVL